MTDAQKLERTLKDWVQNHTGSAIRSWDPIPGGASRLSFALTSTDGAAYFLRVDSGASALSGTRYNLDRERRVIAALQRKNFPVPAIHGWSPELQAILMDHVPGAVGPEGLDNPELQQELIANVVKLQTMPLQPGEFFDTEPLSAAAAIRDELAFWGQLYRERVVRREPAVDLALRWLQDHVPGADIPAVLVHGDIGPGNFLFQQAEITALIDWELAHPGHPLEDLACIIARSLGVPFGDNCAHVRSFERIRGEPMDRDALDYCVMLVLTRFCIGIQMSLDKPSLSLDVSTLLRFRQLNLHVLVGLLAARQGLPVSEPPGLPESQGEVPELFSHIRESLRELIEPAVAEDAFLRHRTHGLLALTSYLEAVNRYGSDRYVQEEQEWLEQLLGRRHADLSSARKALCDAAVDFPAEELRECLRYLVWRSGREHRLLGNAMGAMAERRLEY